MNVVLRFFFWITFLCSVGSKATDSPDFEPLENVYVQLEIPGPDSTNISIIRTFEKVLNLIKFKSYSLLSWKSYSRTEEVSVDKYKREFHFGRWIKPTENCYNTRALVLMRDSQKKVSFMPDDKCSVQKGKWIDDFTGNTFTDRTEIQIDHTVPLKNAYISGAYKWSYRARCLYSNYLGSNYHLKSVNATENMRKGDRTPENYMPPNTDISCNYIKEWLAIKFLWGLKMTVSEANSIRKIIKNHQCNLASFKISYDEIKKQARYANNNLQLCELSPESSE
jgi:hypothetical protein